MTTIADDAVRSAKTTTPSPGLVHVIEEDVGMRDGLESLLVRFQVAHEMFASVREYMRRHPVVVPDCVVFGAPEVDPELEETLHHLVPLEHTPPTIVLARPGDIRSAVQAMQAGAIDCFEKPVPMMQLVKRLQELLPAGSVSLPSDTPVA